MPKHGASGSHSATAITTTSANNLQYGGGISGVGVETAKPQVYLVFWGSQWGTQGTNSAGYTTLSGDPSGMAPYLQSFIKGLGTNNETWSGVMTQYCQGVATGSQTCPSNSAHVGYPTGGALAGVWVDESSAAPSTASGNQIGNEAVKAASHFGNTTQSQNLPVQYVIVFPTGTNPDNYKTQGFCAWHDYTGDSTLSGGAVSSPYGQLAFTNLPYLPDAGSGCGQNFVNSGSSGTLDGVSIVEGHEYAETITDLYPAGGWTDTSGNENGDKCAWISSGQGASQNITLGTGTFAVQSTWANDYNGGSGGCEVSHPIVGGTGANTVTVTNPGNQSSTVGTPASLQIQASDSGSSTLTYSATGLPAGLSINSSTGLISGTPTTAGSSSVTVKATDTTGASGTTSFTWTVSTASGGNTVTVTNPGNQSSTVGTAVSLQIHASDSGSSTLTYSATGLPAGLSINSSTGLISGTPTSAGTSSVTVKATDTTSASGSTSFSWTVTAASSCTASQLLGNPGFETGTAAPWTTTSGVIEPASAGEAAHSGNYVAWLDGYGTTHTDTLAQSVAIPSGCSNYSLSFWLHVDTQEFTTTTAYDTLKVQVLSSSGTVLGTLATYSNLNAASGYQQHTFNLAAYAGKTVTLKFTGSEDSSYATSFVVDDTALNVS